MRGILERWGFTIHEVTPAQPVVEGLGLLIDGADGRVSLTSRRIWKLRLATLALARRRGPPSPKTVEKFIGHFTFAMLIRRENLYPFSVQCTIIVVCRNPVKNFGPMRNAEILQASSLLPLMSTPLACSWDPTVTATDSSETGYGVCERNLHLASVSRVARSCEAWRYQVEGAIKARQSALGLTETSEPPSYQLQAECARVCSSEFEEVPSYVLDADAWHVVLSGEWVHQENILRTEGRALISGVRHKLRALRCHGRRHLMLVDNLSWPSQSQKAGVPLIWLTGHANRCARCL